MEKKASRDERFHINLKNSDHSYLLSATKPFFARREIFPKQSGLTIPRALIRHNKVGHVGVGGIALAGLTVEMIEGRWLAQRVRKDLKLLWTLTHPGHHWHALRGKRRA